MYTQRTLTSVLVLAVSIHFSQDVLAMKGDDTGETDKVRIAKHSHKPQETAPPQTTFTLSNEGEWQWDAERKMYYAGPNLSDLPPLQDLMSPQATSEETLTFSLEGEDDAPSPSVGPDGIVSLNSTGKTEVSSAPEQRQAQASEEEPESVLGSDGREWVKQYNQWPHRVHGHMVMEYGGGSRYIGSGTLIGDDAVITAGHNLFDRKTGRTVKRVTFYPGMDKSNVSWRSTGKGFSIHPKYHDRTYSDYPNVDLAVLRLTVPLGRKLGYYALGALPDSAKGMTVTVTGYPGDLDRGRRMYSMSGPIHSFGPERFFYKIDTAGGQSGSGVWTLVDDEETCVGVHCYGGSTKNSATRLTDAKLKLVMKWME